MGERSWELCQKLRLIASTSQAGVCWVPRGPDVMMSSLPIETGILLGYLTWGVTLPCLGFLEELQMALMGHRQLVSLSALRLN